MRFGIHPVNVGASADPVVLARIARVAEEIGLESLWTGEHVAMPIENNPVPVPAHLPFLDSVVTLTFLAAQTTRIRLATGILVLPHHNPVMLAKALASLDVVSGGRLIAGFASGYVPAEFAAIGVSFKERGALTDEHLQVMQELWTAPEPRFAGRYHSFSGIRFEPKPVQRPHPPIVIGGHVPAALARAARFDGWYGFGGTVEQTVPIVAELRRLRARGPRAATPLEITLTTFEPHDEALVERAAEAGIDRLVPMLRARTADELEDAIRALAPLVRTYDRTV
jgi:probable F420-dependent oxidoreductase